MAGKFNPFAVTAVLSANGTATGYAQVPHVANLYVGATVFLSATGLTTLEGVITEIKGNLVGFRQKPTFGAGGGPSYGNTNISAYTTALAATLVQPSQYVNTDNTVEQDGTGADIPLGVIVATATPVANSNTATPFPLVSGGWYSVQPDVECYVATGVSQADAIAKATATDGVRVDANAKYDRQIPFGHTHMAAASVAAGTVNARVKSIIK